MKAVMMCTPSLQFQRGEDEEGVKIWGRRGRRGGGLGSGRGQCSGKVLQVTAAGASPSQLATFIFPARRLLRSHHSGIVGGDVECSFIPTSKEPKSQVSPQSVRPSTRHRQTD